jgi:hypothetical protein
LFFRNYISSTFHPAFSTAAIAAFEAFETFTVIAFVISPLAKSFIPRVFFLTTLFSINKSLFISEIHSEANSSKSFKFTTLYSFLNILLEKPFNLGNLLNKGV